MSEEDLLDQLDKPHYLGHRQRLRQKLMSAPIGSMQEYEVFELILALIIPRRDVKPLAKDILSKYETISKLLNTDIALLRNDPLISSNLLSTIRLLSEVNAVVLKENIVNKPILSSWKELLDYARGLMGHLTVEQCRILYLDKKYRLITDDVINSGTVDHVPIYPREVVKRASILDSSNVLIIHNHPSGDPEPSVSDIDVTKLLQEALTLVEVKLVDHLIIAHNKHFSFKSFGYL